MPGIANLLYLGQPDPSQQIAQALSGQQPGGSAQGAGPPGANPLPPNGPVPTNAPDPNSPPSPGNPAPNGPQQPSALQSSPDMSASFAQLASPQANNLMSLYLQSYQRDRAEDQINHGLALIAANYAGNPGSARAIMQSVEGGRGDAGGMVNNLMQIYGFQNQQAAMQQQLAHADEYDAKLGYPPGTSRTMILAGRGNEIIQDMKPTDTARNYQWAHDTYAKNHPGASPEEIDAGAQSILLGAGGGGGGELGPMNIARANWLRDPANKDKTPPGYMTDISKWKIYQADISDARTQFGGLNSTLDKFIGDMSDVANNPSLDKITGSTGGILTGTVEGLLPGEVNDLKTKMSGLAAQAKDMASRGGPKGVNQNIKTLGSAPDDFTNAKLTDYRDNVIAPRMRQALTAQANARGTAGMVNAADTPGYLQHYMDKMYQSGGELDIGGAPKTLTPDTDAKGKPLPQPPADVLNDFYVALEHRGPQFALQKLKAAGYDTSSLR